MAISLSKGQTIDLSKQAPGLKRVRMGLGWDPVPKKGGGFLSRLTGGGGGGEIDLDASCLVFDARRDLIDTIWFLSLIHI